MMYWDVVVSFVGILLDSLILMLYCIYILVLVLVLVRWLHCRDVMNGAA